MRLQSGARPEGELINVGYLAKVIPILCLVLTVVVACKGGQDQDLLVPTATPEWFDYYPGRHYVAPGGTETSTEVDPTGSFFEDELIIRFVDGVPKEKVAEILTGKGLEVKRISLSGSFLVKVKPDRREIVLQELQGDPNVEWAEPNFVGYPFGEGDEGGAP